MNNLSPLDLAVAVEVGSSVLLRTIAFAPQDFDLLKDMQRRIESRIRRDTNNSEVIRYLLNTHPETQA